MGKDPEDRSDIALDAERYRDLLHHQSFTVVQESIFFLDDILRGCSFETFMHTLKLLVALEPEEEVLFEPKGFLSFYRQKDIFFDFHHSNYLAVWSLGMLSQFDEMDTQTLELLDLSFPIGESLFALPVSIQNITALQKLDLSGNALARDSWSETFPKEMKNLQKLVYLNLSCNELSELPEVICQLSRLSVLSLRENQLETLPTEIGALQELRVLNIKSNRLRAIPESFGQLTNLTELSLQNNELVTLPEAIQNLGSLRYLDLRQNSFSESEKQKVARLLPLCKIQF